MKRFALAVLIASILAGCQHDAVGTHLGTPFVKQRSSVKTSCFPKKLVAVLADIESHYGKTVVVTSGHRPHAKRRGSQHIPCKAADIRVPGVGRYALAKYAKTIPGVGGVGTYCRKGIVHVDVGPKRTWHDGC
jgi:uncharacterized protein YcbK (DUF882 family)